MYILLLLLSQLKCLCNVSVMLRMLGDNIPADDILNFFQNFSRNRLWPIEMSEPIFWQK